MDETQSAKQIPTRTPTSPKKNNAYMNFWLVNDNKWSGKISAFHNVTLHQRSSILEIKNTNSCKVKAKQVALN